MWLSLIGLWSWKEVPTLPPEQILLPPRAPLSVYSFGCWARQTIVALSVVTALEPSRAVGFGIDELLSGGPSPSVASDLWGKVFVLVDRAAPRLCPPAGRAAAAAGAEDRRALDRRAAGARRLLGRDPAAVGLVDRRAACARLPARPPGARARAIDGLDNFTIEDDDGRRLEACQSPVWDTALSVLALLDAGVDPATRRDRARLRVAVGAGGRTRGDWAVRRPELAPGGFAFEFANENYPDVDDTAVSCSRCGAPGTTRPTRPGAGSSGCSGCRAGPAGSARSTSTTRAGSRRSSRSATSAQSPTRRAPTSPHTCSRRSPTRAAPPTAASARALAAPPAGARRLLVRALGRELRLRHRRRAPRARRVRARGPRERRRRGRLARAGPESRRWVRRGSAFLQGPHLERARRVDGVPDGLGAARAPRRGRGREHVGASAVEWLVETQRRNGGWDEPYFTGTGFPGDFYLRYHLYRDVFPVMALGRILGAAR